MLQERFACLIQDTDDDDVETSCEDISWRDDLVCEAGPLTVYDREGDQKSMTFCIEQEPSFNLAEKEGAFRGHPVVGLHNGFPKRIIKNIFKLFRFRKKCFPQKWSKLSVNKEKVVHCNLMRQDFYLPQKYGCRLRGNGFRIKVNKETLSTGAKVGLKRQTFF